MGRLRRKTSPRDGKGDAYFNAVSFSSFLFLDVLKDARLIYWSLLGGEVGVGKL